jgi:hypothetical protein
MSYIQLQINYVFFCFHETKNIYYPWKILKLHLHIYRNFWTDKNKVDLKVPGKSVCNPILPWKVASMRLPSPVLVHDILPAIFITSHLREDEGALEPGV